MDGALTLLFLEDELACILRGGEDAWEPLPVNGAARSPLYFQVRDDGTVVNDTFAKERFEAGDAGVFGRFYETVASNTARFRLHGGLEREPVELLRDVAAGIRAAYAARTGRSHVEGASGAAIPLRVCMVPGVPPEAARRVLGFLGAQGFAVEPEPRDFIEALALGLKAKGLVAGGTVAVVEASFGDLRFHHLTWREDGGIRKVSETLPGMGHDGRVRMLAEKLVEKACRKTYATLPADVREAQVALLHPRARAVIEGGVPAEIIETVELPFHSRVRVFVRRSEVEQAVDEQVRVIGSRFKAFVSRDARSGLDRIEKLVLRGDVFGAQRCLELFQSEFGAARIVGPLGDVTELLARGIAAGKAHSTRPGSPRTSAEAPRAVPEARPSVPPPSATVPAPAEAAEAPRSRPTPVPSAAAGAASRVTLRLGDREVITAGIETRVGRAHLETFGEDYRYFADQQFRLYRDAGTWMVAHEAAARNDTLVDGQRLATPVPLKDGMRIAVGKAVKGIEKMAMTVSLS